MSHNDDTKNWKMIRRNRGLCPNCGNPNKGTKYLCESCNKKHTDTQHERNRIKVYDKEFY